MPQKQYKLNDITEKLLQMERKYEELWYEHVDQRKINEDLRTQTQAKLKGNVTITGESVEGKIRKIADVLKVKLTNIKCYRIGNKNKGINQLQLRLNLHRFLKKLSFFKVARQNRLSIENLKGPTSQYL